jgi:hypothetical protein
MSAQIQYGRFCSLVVSSAAGEGLDLSGLRIVFKVKKSDAQTPNTATIRVYNLAQETVNKIRKEFSKVMLQAGYDSNYGIIFSGNIKQTSFGREGGTDTFLDIAAGDGDSAYNFAVVNTTLAAGATQKDQINASAAALASHGVSKGHIDVAAGAGLPRGKVMYGMAHKALRQSTKTSNASWSIQDGKMQVVHAEGVLPNQAVVLTSKTGLVGTPEQTADGIKIRCLLNPTLKIGGKVQIDEKDIADAKLQDTDKDAQVNKPVAIEKDGFYRALVVEHSGDTRGNDWYSDIIGLGLDATRPPSKQVISNG